MLCGQPVHTLLGIRAGSRITIGSLLCSGGTTNIVDYVCSYAALDYYLLKLNGVKPLCDCAPHVSGSSGLKNNLGSGVTVTAITHSIYYKYQQRSLQTKMSIDPKFVELTADVLEIFL